MAGSKAFHQGKDAVSKLVQLFYNQLKDRFIREVFVFLVNVAQDKYILRFFRFTLR